MRIVLSILFACLLEACILNGTGIEVAPGWKAQSVTVWRDMRPDMLALSPDRKWLYLTCETKASLQEPSLAAIRLPSGHHVILLNGLNRADGLKFAPDGSLWIGEEFDHGRIWRIAEPNKLPEDQRVDRESLQSSNPSIAHLDSAGVMAHEGIAFSRDGRYAYLADEQEQGGLYRYNMRSRGLEVLHASRGWLQVRQPDEARVEATKLAARTFNRIEDMETLPDGRILMAETGTGRILMLDDQRTSPEVKPYLEQPQLRHPDNLAWDAKRQWLWITDDDKPSILWAWDGRRLIQIARHAKAEITGVLIDGDTVYFNLQGNKAGPELTMKLIENHDRS